MFKFLFSSALGIFLLILWMCVHFPGGTIFMALACKGESLSGFDWVLSVILPIFGLFKGLMCF